MNDFCLDLKYSLDERDNKIFDDFYYSAFPLLEKIEFCESMEFQTKGIDKLLYLQTSKVISIDEKKRRKDYGDIALELWKNKERKKPGWLFYSQCDYIVYAIIPSNKVFLLPTLLLQLAWKNNKFDWLSKYPRKLADNKFYHTENICIPENVIIEAIKNELQKELYVVGL